MRSAAWLWRAAGWDGVLPVAVASVPVLLRTFLPRGHLLLPFAAVCVPIVAAMVRASIGRQQIVRTCGEPPPVGRQIGLAVAIVLLLLFELSVGVLTCEQNEPAADWCFPAVMFSLYLITIVSALRPACGAAEPIDLHGQGLGETDGESDSAA